MNTPPVLTLSQMRELQVLGLDCSDASMCFVAMMHKSDTDNLMLWAEGSYASVKKTLPVGWAIFPAYTLQDLFNKFPYNTIIENPRRDGDGWFMEFWISEPEYKYARGDGKNTLEAAFKFVKSCLECGLIQPKETPESTYTLTKEAQEQLASKVTAFLEKGKRIERGESKADATLSGSFIERLEADYKKQKQKDAEREIESIHFGSKGNGLLDGMLTYKDEEEKK